MTAVEFIVEQVLEYKSPTNVNGTDYILIPVDKINFLQEQAKEMEKEKMINFHIGAMKKGLEYENEEEWNDGDFPLIKKTAEQYYNETFKSE